VTQRPQGASVSGLGAMSGVPEAPCTGSSDKSHHRGPGTGSEMPVGCCCMQDLLSLLWACTPVWLLRYTFQLRLWRLGAYEEQAAGVLKRLVIAWPPK
jgi:hypothetical protein